MKKDEQRKIALKTAIFLLFFLLSGISPLYAEPDAVIYRDSMTTDEQENRLVFPSFVMSDHVTNEIYIIDGKGRIIIYTKDLFPLLTINKKYGIETPQGLTTDEKGNLYIAQMGNADNPRHRISVLSPCLSLEREIYFSGLEGDKTFIPHRLAVDKKGYIYVAANHYPGVLVLNNDGMLVDRIIPEENNHKAMIVNVTADSSGKVYLVSEEEGRIYVYDEDRNFLFKFGEKGGSSGKLSRPKGVAVDNKTGMMYVVDYMRHTVSTYDNKGTYLYEFGGLGLDAGWFQFPSDIAVDEEGKILVVDFFNNRVQVFATRVTVAGKK